VATYPPYNRHLLHDIGAFQLGLAAALLAGIVGRRGLAVALWGGTVGATAHAVSVWMDDGPFTNRILVTAVAVVVAAGLVAAETRQP
jgi:hypothetical protein